VRVRGGLAGGGFDGGACVQDFCDECCFGMTHGSEKLFQDAFGCLRKGASV